MSELWRKTAVEAKALLDAGEVSPLDLIDAAEARIAEVDGKINATPTLCFDRARDHARRIMDGAATAGVLGGMPVAIKDLNAVAGVRTTWGSLIFKDHVPEVSDFLVQVVEQQGGVVIGKTNTPEFGAGASTFNEVFGVTRNPWNLEKSVAGSSGGAAAALAAGEVWLATGSDLGGSLRTPAGFNGIFGLRPTPGRAPIGPVPMPFNYLGVNGPMGRTAEDVAFFLDALSIGHPRDPVRLPPPETPYLETTRAAGVPKRIAWAPDLGGITPVDPEVRAICEAAVRQLADAGAEVVETCPDFSNAYRAFQTLRAVMFANAQWDNYNDPERCKLLKPEVIWNVEAGLKLTAEDIVQAEMDRTALIASVMDLFEDVDILIAPTAIVPPYPAEDRYVEEACGVKFESYIDWIQITFALTLTTCPVISCPAGLANGLPVGLQIVAAPRREDIVLGAAHVLDGLTGLSGKLPITPT